MTGVLIQRGNLDTKTDMHDVKTQGELVIFRPKREAWNRWFLIDLGRNQRFQHLDLRLPAPRSVSNKNNDVD